MELEDESWLEEPVKVALAVIEIDGVAVGEAELDWLLVLD